MKKELAMEMIQKVFGVHEYQFLEDTVIFKTMIIRVSEDAFVLNRVENKKCVFEKVFFMQDSKLEVVKDKYSSPNGWNCIVEINFSYDNIKEITEEKIAGIGRVTKILEEHIKREDFPEENLMFVYYPDGGGRYMQSGYYDEYCFNWREKK